MAPVEKFNPYTPNVPDRPAKLPKLPNLPTSEILSLPGDQFAALAKEFGVSEDKLRGMLEKSITDKRKRAEEIQDMPGREAAKDEYTEKAHQALAESAEEIDIFNIQSSNSSKKIIEEYENKIFSAYRKIGDRSLRSLEGDEKREIIELYKKFHLAKAVSTLAPLDSYEGEKAPYYEVYQRLNDARRESNDLLEKEALSSVINAFWRLYREEGFNNTLELCAIIARGGKLNEDQQIAKTRILSKARSWAMSGKSPLQYNEAYGSLITAVAQRLIDMKIWKKEIDGVSGPSEVFGMTGSAGIGGQINYLRGPRPHRDDYGSSGGPDDK